MKKKLNQTIQLVSPYTMTALISLRFGFAMLLPLLIILDEYTTAACVISLAILTDFLDGYVGRRGDQIALFGSYGDALADFVLVTATFSALVVTGLYSAWIMPIILVMFLQFLVTSHMRKPTYDPIGKYYGLVLFLVIGITLLWPSPPVALVGTATVVTFALLTIVSRFLYLTLDRRKFG